MDYAVDWRLAAHRYEVQAAGHTLTPKPQKLESFQDWIESAEGKAAQFLLHAANREIVVAESAPSQGRTRSVIFAGTERVLLWDGVIPTEKPERQPLTLPAFVNLAMEYHSGEWHSEVDLISFLREAVQVIANESP